MPNVTKGDLGRLQDGIITMTGTTPVVVPYPTIARGNIVLFGLNTVGGTVVAGTGPNVVTITPGTGFSVATGSTDTSTYTYLVF